MRARRRSPLLGGAERVVGDDQAVAGEGVLRQPVLIEFKGAEGIDQLTVSARRHRQDELQPAVALISHRCQLVDIVQAQQPAIGDQDDALDGEALQHRRHMACKVFVSATLPGWTVCMSGRPSAVCTTPSTNCRAIPPRSLFMPKARMSSSTAPSP